MKKEIIFVTDLSTMAERYVQQGQNPIVINAVLMIFAEKLMYKESYGGQLHE